MGKFTQPDSPRGDNEKPEVSAQKEAETPINTPQPHADGIDAFDMADYIAQPREGASTGTRKKLEANEFVDEDLLQEADYSDTGEAESVTAETIATEQTEISEEWLEIFAWAGVELTDEAMPRLLQYLHAENDHTRFKLPPTRRDKLKLAWIAFLSKVLPAMDDKQGLLAVIVMLYIENLVVGVWKLAGRIMAGTFQWPQFWPFTRFGKKKEAKEEAAPSFTNQPQEPAPPPQPSADEVALMDEEIQPAPSIVKQDQEHRARFEQKPEPKTLQLPAEEVAKVKLEPQTVLVPVTEQKPEVILAPVPTDIGNGMVQDPIDSAPFAKEDGMPKKDWEKQAKGQSVIYRVPAKTFRTQKTFQNWLWKNGFYNNRGKK